MRSRPLYDLAALLARLGVGVIFMAHGWQKIEAGITATGRTFDDMGVPFPTGAAVYSAFAELLGGTLLIAGLGLPVVGALLFVDMAGAFVFVQAGNGLFLVDDTGRARNGWELVAVLGLISLLFAVGDGGRLSLDHVLFDGSGRPRGLRRSRRSREDDEDDGQSFVDALRAADEAPARGLEKQKKPSSRSSSKGSTSKNQLPTLPEAAARPTAPSSSSSSSSPAGRDARLASDIMSGSVGTEDDTLVAGRRKSRRRRSDTQPIKRNGGDKSPSS
jgi:putative oxidoreductase